MRMRLRESPLFWGLMGELWSSSASSEEVCPWWCEMLSPSSRSLRHWEHSLEVSSSRLI